MPLKIFEEKFYEIASTIPIALAGRQPSDYARPFGTISVAKTPVFETQPGLGYYVTFPEVIFDKGTGAVHDCLYKWLTTYLAVTVKRTLELPSDAEIYNIPFGLILNAKSAKLSYFLERCSLSHVSGTDRHYKLEISCAEIYNMNTGRKVHTNETRTYHIR